MDDGLFSLCRICNVHQAKYTCPRCSIQTCSLPCSRRHKLWASCSGIRDPTVFKPKSELATPSGVDHDYNFLHSIEHRIERSEKLIVEERNLVDNEELKLARAGEEDRDRKRRKQGPQHAGEEPIQKSLQQTRTTVLRAPKGMRRNLENETSWSRNQRSINWQAEWVRGDISNRILSKAMGKNPIGDIYAAILEAERKRNLSPEEQRMEKKRKNEGPSQRAARKRKVSSNSFNALLPTLQDPETGAWSLTSSYSSFSGSTERNTTISEAKPTLPPSCHLYLLRPHTPSSYPKVLAPIEPSQSLETVLRHRTVLEFPTIYVLDVGPRDLPEHFILEQDFLKITGQAQAEDSDALMDDAKDDSSDEETEDSDSSSSSGSSADSDEADSDEEMEEGEIVPTVWGIRG